MATYQLVGFRDHLASLVQLSLRDHDVPVTGVFNIFDPSTGSRFIGIASPLVETEGKRTALMKVFSSLEDETFSTKTFLRLHIVMLSAEDYKEIRRSLRRGMSDVSLSQSLQFSDVIVIEAEDPKSIRKTGMLLSRLAKDGTVHVSFGDVDGGGAVKGKLLTGIEALEKLLSALGASGSSAQEALIDLRRSRVASIPISCSLEQLYLQGLI